MPHPLFPAASLALAVPMLAAGDAGVDLAEGQVTTMTFHERIIVRIPKLGPPPPQFAWKEKRGPKCVVAADLAGALVPAPGIVDLVLAGNRRVRARLDGGCAPLDFYSGFYMKPAADGKICAGRDTIRARSGLSCPIESLHALKAVKIKP